MVIYCIIKVEKRYTDEGLRCLAENPFCVALAKQKDCRRAANKSPTELFC
jgi:hypothetical protein